MKDILNFGNVVKISPNDIMRAIEHVSKAWEKCYNNGELPFPNICSNFYYNEFVFEWE